MFFSSLNETLIPLVSYSGIVQLHHETKPHRCTFSSAEGGCLFISQGKTEAIPLPLFGKFLLGRALKLIVLHLHMLL